MAGPMQPVASPPHHAHPPILNNTITGRAIRPTLRYKDGLGDVISPGRMSGTGVLPGSGPRPMRSGSLSISNAPRNHLVGAPRFDGPRSPPNTSHVPCKFYKHGACQAGATCQFSHDLGPQSEQLCKYFTKGNCKFGPKCANIHVLPDGRRVNYGKNGIMVGAPPMSFGNANAIRSHNADSALTQSFLGADGGSAYTYEGRDGPGVAGQPTYEGVPTIDTTEYLSPGSPYGSPRPSDEPSRFGMGLSPPGSWIGRSILDAPLPASFDPNGISHAARYGPWPSSLPSNFLQPSPTPSVHNAKEGRASDTLRALHTSAFGAGIDRTAANEVRLGASPSSGAIGEELLSRRINMHSSNTRFTRPRLLSSSAPKVDQDWDQDDIFQGEDYVPSALANELLTPEEKARRSTGRDSNELGDGQSMRPAATSSSFKRHSYLGSSPSRWGPLFQKQKEEEESRSVKGPSAFGHVGSPLRNSSLANGLDGIHGRSTTESSSVSALTQQIQNTRLREDGGSSPLLHPNSAHTIGNNSINGSSGRLERNVSAGSASFQTYNRLSSPIDEEEPSLVFAMDNDEMSAQSRAAKRISSNSNGLGWSYASVAARQHSRDNVTDEASASGSTR